MARHLFTHSLLFILPFYLLACDGSSEHTSEKAKKPDAAKEKEKDRKNDKSRSQDPKKLFSYGIDTSEGIPKGLKVGDRAPAFETLDAKGDTVTQDELLADGPLLLFFYRGQWCPVCNKTLSAYADSLERVRDQGITPLAVTPETAPNVDSMRGKSGIGVRVIPDTSRSIMKDYRVLFNVTSEYEDKIRKKLSSDIAANNAAKEAYLPVPATYLIDEEGKVVWRHFYPDYKERASVRAIIKASEKL